MSHPRATSRTVRGGVRTTAASLALVLTATLLVLGVGLASAPPGQGADTSQYGRTFAKSGVLKKGCRSYRYRYDINPPDSGPWALEVFISGPGGKNLFSDGILQGFQGTEGRRPFRICRTATRPGRFKIRARLTTVDGNDEFKVWLPVTRFKLRNRR